MTSLPEIFLLLFILNLGTAFGAGLYETKIVIPIWFQRLPGAGYTIDSEAMRKIDTGRKFWGFVTTGPLTLITLSNVFFAWQSFAPLQPWWLAAALITLLERIGTFAFFIPTAIKLQKADGMKPERRHKLVSAWIGFNYLRNALTLAAWIGALLAGRELDSL